MATSQHLFNYLLCIYSVYHQGSHEDSMVEERDMVPALTDCTV